MKADPRIDDYIARAAPFAQPILVHVRSLVHSVLPDAEEGIKWGIPHFMVGGKNVVGMAAFKAHASVIIHGEDQSGEGMGSLGKLASQSELPEDKELAARILAGRDAISRHKKKPVSKAAIAIPGDFAAALAASERAQKAFDGFTDAQRRDYLEWVVSAKREATRSKRIETAIEWIGEGKRRNWKYEKC